MRIAHFQLVNGGAGQLNVPVQVVSIEDRLDVVQAMSGDGRDLRLRASDQREPGDCSAPEIVEGQGVNPGFTAPLLPRRPETVRRPRLVLRTDKNNRTALRHRIEGGLERCTDRYRNVDR